MASRISMRDLEDGIIQINILIGKTQGEEGSYILAAQNGGYQLQKEAKGGGIHAISSGFISPRPLNDMIEGMIRGIHLAAEALDGWGIMTLLEAIKEAGIEYRGHYSDLYLPNTEEARAILSGYPLHLKNHSLFNNQIEGEVWIDIPFAYDPFWQAKQKEGERRAALKSNMRYEI